MRSPAGLDPFGTQRLRATVLAAWAASPARFREDANAEEELAKGAYRDRVIVELAQNAADAASRAGVPGRVLLRLDGAALLAANTGASLDAAGVEGLCTLRASTKRDESAVGRFGVGFAAVLAVSDEPAVLSRTGGVRWSRHEAVTAVAALPELAAELARRGSAVPVLRLPRPADGAAPPGYDTAVWLPLRDDTAVELVRSLLDALDDAILLALPAIEEIVIDTGVATRTLHAERRGSDVVVAEADRRTRWRLVERTGSVPAELLADRPVEDPDRWQVAVAVPVQPHGGPAPLPPSVPRVVHAPTPTDERTDLPVLLLGSFPLDSSRRRVVPGRLTDLLAGEVAAAYADIVQDLAAAGPAVLDLIPGPLPASELDATLQGSVMSMLGDAEFVPAVRPVQAGRPDRLAPRDVVLVEGLRTAADPAAMAGFVAGLAEPQWWRTEQLRRLGATVIDLAEVVDSLGELKLEPPEWRELYAALDGSDLEALARLPVPLADGRVVRGARGVLLATGDVDTAILAPLGLRVAAAEAVHPLLTRIGATEASAAVVLRDPAVRAAVDAEDETVSDSVLRLVQASGLTADEEPWLARTLVPDGTGSLAPAGELWFPDCDVLELLDVNRSEYTVHAATVRRWGRTVLRAIGARDGFAVLRAPDVPLADESWHDLDDEPAWQAATVGQLPDQEVPPLLTELVAVCDLDLVHEGRWADALAMLAAEPGTRRAVTEPAHVLLSDGSSRAVPPYTAWWLREHARIGGVSLGLMAAPDAEPLVSRVLPAVPVPLDESMSRALGLARSLADLAGQPDRLLDRLADPSLQLSAADLTAVYGALVAAGPEPESVAPPELVRVPDGESTRVVPADDVLVAAGPYWLQLAGSVVLPGGAELSALLDLPLAGELADPYPSSSGRLTEVPAAARRVLSGVPTTYVEHDELHVEGTAVDWWVDPRGTVHAATTDGLARGLAWAAGRWEARLELAEALRDPAIVANLLAERAFDGLARGPIVDS
ncbi:MAG TPA: hypothetical protein VFY84_02635 [Jiangellales bacterium]|nr:hypothetical protein [Jiangellales bacterium]